MEEELVVEEESGIVCSYQASPCQNISASDAEEDPCPLALARKAPHRQTVESLTLSSNGEDDTTATEPQPTKTPNQA